MNSNRQPRLSNSRVLYAVCLLVTIVLGMASRRYSAHLPPLLHKNAGDILWATAVYFLILLIRPRISLLRAFALAVLIGVCVELFKLYNPPWLHAFRQTMAGGLLLGHAFSWSNMVCYAVGAALGLGVGWLLSRQKFNT